MAVTLPTMFYCPPDATEAERMRLYRKYAQLLVDCNRRAFLPPGVKKRWWHLFRIEYPKILLQDFVYDTKASGGTSK